MKYFEKAKTGAAIFQMIIEKLPKTSNHDQGEHPGFWTNGSQILCPTEEDANMLAEFLQNILKRENISVLTGYYDPAEDAGNEEVDECTGYWYVDIE